MIVVQLAGGLGNQMFQYAAGRRLALARGTELLLDLGWFRDESPFFAAPRPFELAPFALPARYVLLDREALARCEEGRPVRLGSFPRRRRRLAVLREEACTAEEVIGGPADALLVGYWQDERYFEDVSETIRADFGLLPPQSELRSEIEGTESISVHVRRGDYAEQPETRAFHGALAPEYYRAAVDLVAERLCSPRVFVFSDDPEWACRHLRFDQPVRHISGPGRSALDDLLLLSRCRHHVIANSSFSWWGAWLGTHPGKIVVAPRRWFADPAAAASRTTPRSWVTV